LRDVAQGLRFLHAADPKVIHGDLKAQNILVSSNFRAKVCDFGLSHTRNNWLGAVGTPYWMAPELLRGESKNTAPSDVYSFGIMLYEIYSRRDPYEGEDYKHVLRLARDPAVNKRPPVPERCPKTVATVMKHCVVNNPKERPTFEELDLLMKGLDLADVEPKKIACSLQDYLEERQPRRGDRLDERFPAHVADALREGRKLEPESRKMVSLFYSEIVRLGDIVGDHGAEKTSNLLRSLYDRFDVLAREYDVFKIETIGDSYMVASNLAKDQVDHAKRIVEFANSAIKTASETLIDPEKGHLKIRVGFHSGPLVANVVGERHPRYSIFGDSVNTAIRMVHDSGENRIHCSEVAARLVRQQYPETSIRSRGVINVKGKGEMHTYWVNVRSPDSKSDNAVSVDFSFDSSQQSSQERDVNFGNIVSTGVPEESAIPVTVTVSEHAHDEKANNETDDSTEADPTKSSLQLFMKYRNTQV
jgi:serine/threonine protein kinase